MYHQHYHYVLAQISPSILFSMRNLKRSLKSGIVLVSAPTFSYKVSYNRIFYTLITFFLIHSHVLRKTFYLKVLNVYSSLIRKTKFQTYEKISFYHLCSFLSLLFYERMNYKSITEIYERLFRIRITILLVLTRYIFFNVISIWILPMSPPYIPSD